MRPVKNGDARLKHTATEKTAAVPVAEAESTKVLPRSALRHRGDHSRAPPGKERKARIVLPGDCPPVESSQCQSGMRYCQWEAWQLTFRPRAVGMGMGMGRAVGTCDGLLGKVDAGKVERR